MAAAPVLIGYDVFLANAQEEDIRALALLAQGELVKTMDLVEADGYEAAGVRLYNAGLLTRMRRSLEVIGTDTWHVFDGRVAPGAINYVATAAMERVMLSRSVIPPGP